jgi:hypothetical protein
VDVPEVHKQNRCENRVGDLVRVCIFDEGPGLARDGLDRCCPLRGAHDYFEQQAPRANPSADDEFLAWYVGCQRFNASPGAALNFRSE